MKMPELSVISRDCQSARSMKFLNCFCVYHSKPVPPLDSMIFPPSSIKFPAPIIFQPAKPPEPSGANPDSAPRDDVVMTLAVRRPSASAVRDGFAEPIAGNKDRKSTRLNSSHGYISYAVFC